MGTARISGRAMSAATRDIPLTGIDMAVTFALARARCLARVTLPLLLIALWSCSGPATVLRVEAPTRAPRPLVRHDVAPIPLSPPQDSEATQTLSTNTPS